MRTEAWESVSKGIESLKRVKTEAPNISSIPVFIGIKLIFRASVFRGTYFMLPVPVPA